LPAARQLLETLPRACHRHQQLDIVTHTNGTGITQQRRNLIDSSVQAGDS